MGGALCIGLGECKRGLQCAVLGVYPTPCRTGQGHCTTLLPSNHRSPAMQVRGHHSEASVDGVPATADQRHPSAQRPHLSLGSVGWWGCQHTRMGPHSPEVERSVGVALQYIQDPNINPSLFCK